MICVKPENWTEQCFQRPCHIISILFHQPIMDILYHIYYIHTSTDIDLLTHNIPQPIVQGISKKTNLVSWSVASLMKCTGLPLILGPVPIVLVTSQAFSLAL